MTLRLILMRHAKSDWSLSLDDHDRVLNDRGRRSATALGVWLKERDYLPDLAVVSSSARTRETLSRLEIETPAEFERSLYLADVRRLWTTLHGLDAQTVLLLGHNPGIADFAAQLVAKPPAHERFDDYPTGATLVVDFDAGDWSGVAAKSGHVVDFVIPREIL